MFDKYLTQLYGDHSRVLSEKNILFTGVKNSRPDKILIEGKNAIVIDFKTGEPRKSHEKQIIGYSELLTKMGYENIRKGLLYTEETRMVWVD